MAREHSRIKMTPEELDAYLASNRRVIVATLTDDGDPWADAAAYVYRDGRLYFRVPTGTRTLEHLRRDGMVCCVVESKPDDSTYYGIKGAMLHGGAVTLGDGEGDDIRQALADIADPVEPDRTDGEVFSVGLEDSTSFSFDKIQGRYQEQSVKELQEAAERG
jgi:nitroimidazol reductase NimA-like FMN-containing flavoprotein (pyridoxamine 5'-phosphate oxidase superfamily)